MKRAHAEKPLDLIWAYVMPFEWDASTYQAIHKLGIPVAIWSLDDKHVFVDDRHWPYPHDQKELIGSCDIHLTSSMECVRWYLAEGVPAYYFPEAVDLELYLPAEGMPDYPVSFVGQAYGWRIKLIHELKRMGDPDCMFWPRMEKWFCG